MAYAEELVTIDVSLCHYWRRCYQVPIWSTCRSPCESTGSCHHRLCVFLDELESAVCVPGQMSPVYACLLSSASLTVICAQTTTVLSLTAEHFPACDVFGLYEVSPQQQTAGNFRRIAVLEQCKLAITDTKRDGTAQERLQQAVDKMLKVSTHRCQRDDVNVLVLAHLRLYPNSLVHCWRRPFQTAGGSVCSARCTSFPISRLCSGPRSNSRR